MEKFKAKQVKGASAAPAAPSKTKEKKSKEVTEEALAPYVEDTPKGQKKSTLSKKGCPTCVNGHSPQAFGR